jgi:indolepyruvate ferredoxin oxidoreductase beta subunit
LESYPEDAVQRVQEKADAYALDAFSIAEGLGNAKSMNIVLLGAMVKKLGLQDLGWVQAIKDCVKPSFLELNLLAFEAGNKAV